jgi:GntR family transcriptional regulator/MocR family aminotransferase
METFSIKWQKNSITPLYEQLYLHIKEEIISGRLAFAGRLPSKRLLQRNLNVSQTTIETAYEQLMAEGYIDSRPRKGFFVSANEEFLYRKESDKPAVSMKKRAPANKIIHDLYPGIIDNSMFPFFAWRRIYREALSPENKDLLLLGQPQGEDLLRDEIKKYLYQSRGVVCKSEQIIIGAGIEQLLPQLVLLLGEKSVYGIENPGYPLTRHVLSMHNKKYRYVNVDSEGAKVEEITDSPINTMYVTPSHQFPLGSIMSVNRRAQLLRWAYNKKNRYIIEDDYDSEFRYYGRPIPSLHSLGHGKKVIYLSTFSKSLMPSLRIGYMVLPENLQKLYKKKFSGYSSCVSRIDQHVLGRFMQSGRFEKHLNRMRTAYRKKIELLTSYLEPFKKHFSTSGNKAGLHILLTFNENFNEERLVNAALKKGIRLCGLSAFCGNENRQQRPAILLGFGAMNEKQLIRALDKLMNAWQLS